MLYLTDTLILFQSIKSYHYSNFQQSLNTAIKIQYSKNKFVPEMLQIFILIIPYNFSCCYNQCNSTFDEFQFQGSYIFNLEEKISNNLEYQNLGIIDV